MKIHASVYPAPTLGLIVAMAWPLLSQSTGGLQGLTPYSDLFDTGRQRFLKVEDVASGLGPSYNGTSCGEDQQGRDRTAFRLCDRHPSLCFPKLQLIGGAIHVLFHSPTRVGDHSSLKLKLPLSAVG